MLMKKLSKVTSAFLSLLLVILTWSCASPPKHKFLEPNIAAMKDYNAQVLSIIPTKEISIYFNRSNVTAGGGSILFMLIEAGVNKARKNAIDKQVIPLIDAAAEIDFRKIYWDKLKEALSGTPWLKVKKLDMQETGYSKEQLAALHPPFLQLETSYQLSPTAQFLCVVTSVNLYLDELNKKDYFGTYIYFSDRIGASDEKDEKAIQLWSANNAAAYRNAVDEGVQQNILMLNYDLLGFSANSPESNDNQSITFLPPPPFRGSTKAKVLSRSNGRIFARVENGNLISIPEILSE